MWLIDFYIRNEFRISMDFLYSTVHCNAYGQLYAVQLLSGFCWFDLIFSMA